MTYWFSFHEWISKDFLWLLHRHEIPHNKYILLIIIAFYEIKSLYRTASGGPESWGSIVNMSATLPAIKYACAYLGKPSTGYPQLPVAETGCLVPTGDASPTRFLAQCGQAANHGIERWSRFL